MLVRPARADAGFTLVEIMVTLTIFALVLGLGIPNLMSYAASARVKSSASALYAGVQRARSEAIRTNALVELVFTNDVPTAANVDVLVPVATGVNWAIRTVPQPLPLPGLASVLIESRLGNEGGGDAIASNAGGVGVIRFNGLGAVVAPAAAVTVAFNHTTMNPGCLMTEAVRCVNVMISLSGQSRLCEPGRAANDSRNCN